MINCILAGVGGQGTVLASKLIAQAAMNKGLNARTAETIGMAQRGGCVVSHVRIGEGIHSPLIPFGAADAIIGFEPAEAVRCMNYLKQGGTVIVSSRAIKPVTASLGGSGYDSTKMLEYLRNSSDKVLVVDTETICAECGSSKVINIALLGAAVASGILSVSFEEMEKTLGQKIPPKYLEMNLKAFRLGFKYVLKENAHDDRGSV